MKPGMHVSVVLVFLAIALLEMKHGHEGLKQYRADEHRKRMAIIGRWQQRVAARLGAAFETCQHQADYLAQDRGVRVLLDSMAAGGQVTGRQATDELVAAVRPFLGFHTDILEIRLYGADGRIRAGAGRGSEGWAPIDEPEPEPEVRDLIADGIARGYPQSAFANVDLVPTGNGGAQMAFRCAAIVTGIERGRGLLTVAGDASGMLEEVSSFSSPPGSRAALLDASGQDLAALWQGDVWWLEEEDPHVLEELRRGAQEHETSTAVYMSAGLGASSLRIVVRVPREALRRATRNLRYEYFYVLGPYVVVVVVLGIWGWLVLGLSRRAVRMAEAQRYAERIEREHQKYRALLEGAADMILIVEPSSEQVRECNAIARDTLGIGEGAPLADFVEDESLRTLRAALRQARELAGRPVTMPEILAGKDRVPADGRLAVIDLGEEQVIQVSLRDLRERKQLERQLQISDRLSMLGMMTAGVAHEINNPLEGIGNYLVLLEKEGLTPEKRTRYMGNVRHGFERIRDIVRHFGAMVRPEPDRDTKVRRQRTLDLSRVVSNSVKLLSHTDNLKRIQVKLIGLGEPVIVAGDEAQLEQVFWNLLLNAGRAMEGQGQITITARPIEDPTTLGEVEITVEDEGPGIPEEYLERIFDPFFTRAHGSGLGLFVSYGILQAHGGSLGAENIPDPETPGRNLGARFTLRLIRGQEQTQRGAD